MVKIKSLYHFPIKSLGGKKLNSGELIDTGLKDDRKYMLIDEDNKFVTLRKYPELALISAGYTDGEISLNDDEHSITDEVFVADTETAIPTRIWKSDVEVIEVSPRLGKWISDIIGAHTRLVKLSEHGRQKMIFNNEVEMNLLFTDGYPIHIINQASLDYLSGISDRELSPLRFRPNLILTGLKPFEELRIDKITGAEFSVKVVKPTKRCVVTNVNPKSGVVDSNVLRTMGQLKQNKDQISFGIYAYPLKKGKVFSGEDLSIKFS